ncbi:MAG: sugar ABC transporter permease [Gorillibacterium sp.]|nr:sugar ABC transporter permease [Gorillibacterium sp.]
MRKKSGLYMHYHLMLLPGFIFLIIFSLYPMTGLQLAFKDFNPVKGVWDSPWVGWKHFQFLISNSDSFRVFNNTVAIASMKIVFNLIAPIVFALLLNEVRIRWFKRTVQTVVYLPYFLSWVILAGMFRDIFSLDGIVNHLLISTGAEPFMFFAHSGWFRGILIGTEAWRDFGFGAIIYLAAITNINPNLYEAAAIDGASRWQQLGNITLPGLAPTIVLLTTLSLQNVLNAGFDQIFNMYNTMVMDKSDIIDTYVYRVGLQQAQYELGTALGLFKSVISFALIILASKLASKYANYRIF